MEQVLLYLDFESRSRVDLKTRGLDNYAKDPSTEILMMGWAINNDAPRLWFPHVEPLPEHLRLMMTRREIPKVAYNAEFERVMAREVLGIDIPIEQWIDPSVMARYASMAGNLGFVGNILGLPEDVAKKAEGKKLIRKFCVPKKNGDFNDWNSHPEEWAAFCEYCCFDVRAEREVLHKLKAFSLPPQERRMWHLDQKINERGLPVDMLFVNNAAKIVETEHGQLTDEFVALTGLENPNSVKQLLPWLKEQAYPYNSLGKKWVAKALGEGVGFENTGISQKGRRGLELRQLVAKSSTAKIQKLVNMVSSDGYARRMYVYYGAPRTGRMSGKDAQPQNFPRGTIKDFDGAVEAIRSYAA